MPRFEIYQSQLTPSDSGVQASQAGYGGVQALQQAGEEAIQTVDYIANAWEEADYLSQMTTASNNYQEQILNYEADVATLEVPIGDDGDFYKAFNAKKSEYESRLDAIKANTSTITNSRAKKDFENIVGLDYAKTKVKLEAAFRNKQIEHQKVELVRNGDLLRRSYITNGSEDLKTFYKAQLERNYQAGFIDEEEKMKFEVSMSNWDSQRILQVAQVDPIEAFRLLEEKTDLDPKERASLKGDIKGIQASNKIEADVRVEERYSINREELTQEIISPDLSYTEKKDLLDNAYMYDDIDKESFDRLSSALTSRNTVDARTNMVVKSNLLVEIKQMSSEFPTDYIKQDKTNAREYYRRKKQLENKIISEYNKGSLSTNDYSELIKEASQNNSMPAKEGALAVTIKDEVNYSETFEAISKQIGSADARADAINEYYTIAKRMVLETDPKNRDFKQLKNEVIKKYKAMQLKTASNLEDDERATIIEELKTRGYAGTDEQVAYVLSKRSK